MNKIKKSFINKISSFSDDFSKNFSEVAVNITLQRDFYKKTKRYKDIVEILLPEYLDNYIKCCEYLYYDFKVKKAKIDNVETDIRKEINLKEQVEDILNQKMDRKVVSKLRIMIKKTKSIFEYNKQFKRWWILSTILENYGDILKLLEKKAGKTEYKEISIIDEIKKLKRDDYLIENFNIGC